MSVFISQVFGGEKSGFQYSLVINGAALGYVIFSPVRIYLQSWMSWQTAFTMSFGAFLLLSVDVFIFCRETPPHPNDFNARQLVCASARVFPEKLGVASARNASIRAIACA